MVYPRDVTADPLDFRLVFEQSPHVVLVLAPDGPRYTMIAASDARLAVTLLTRDETIGHGLFEVFPDNPADLTADGTSNLRASLDRVLAARAPDTMAVQKYDIRGPDGTFQVRFWSPRNIPILSDTGAVRYILHCAEDVTDLVRAGEMDEELRDRSRQMERDVVARSRELASAVKELREANLKLGELDAAKTAFFSNVSHEFRTPLTLMLGPLEDTLADSTAPLTADQQERLRLAHQNALRLLKLVNALLDFSRLEAGRLQARFGPVDLAAFTAELGGMFQSALSKAALRLTLDCPPLAEPVWIDRDLFEKVVANLLSNAFKFTFTGGITLRLRDAGTAVVLEVIDTGTGIAAAELPKVFERFHRVSGSVGRTHEGTGIGLALVREIVELHGGTVSVESTVGQGTTFRVRVPKGFAHLPADAVSGMPIDPETRQTSAAYAAEAARWDAPVSDGSSVMPSSDAAPASWSHGAPAVSSDAPPGARAEVLVVDDNPDLRAYIRGLLAPHYDVTTAADGAAALDVLRGARLPDLVVSDVMMPRLDGVGLVKALRAETRTAALPVILLSARAGEESTITGLDAGSDDYLAKPFSARELLARVRTHIELARARRAWIGELERINRDLDAFSSSVSHDLRAPLRAIEGFSRLLGEDYAAALDERGQGYVDRIGANVQKMSTLIDDLLRMAKITRATLDAKPIDLSVMAEAVVGDLRRAHPERAMTVEIAPGLQAVGDRRLVHLVLVNLIGNAWKYTGRTAAARIEIGRLPGVPTTFFVRDNGAGFEMAHAKHLFEPFHRLHGEDFEGTGVGLATVERIVSRHGGRVWAEAAVGQGATFLFTL